MPDPLHTRAAEISAHLRRLFESARVPFSCAAFVEGDYLRYFPPATEAEFSRLAQPPFVHLAGEENLSQAKVLIATATGADMSQSLRELRRRAHPDAFIALWFWDNHVAHVANLRSALAADLLFPSHAYDCAYLTNPVSAIGPHVPLCSAQWTADEAARLYAELGSRPRKEKLLVNYVDYPWAWRSALLRTLAAQAPEAEVLSMPPDSRERYFAKSSAERFREWTDYKCTIMLPVDKDLSTRFFDALLAGLVPVVPRLVEDFDAVVPPADQEQLGIVRIDNLDVATIRRAAREAADRFDRMGPAVAQARHRYALENHLLAHRVHVMLNVIRSLATGDARLAVLPDGGLHTAEKMG